MATPLPHVGYHCCGVWHAPSAAYPYCKSYRLGITNRNYKARVVSGHRIRTPFRRCPVCINSFGAMFLIMVSLTYFMYESKEKHWLRVIERKLSQWGRIESIEIAIALTLLAIISFLVPAEATATVLISGIIGVVLFLIMQGIISSFSISAVIAASGLALFLYLNILDSAFSLDSVVGAFALSASIPIIAVGLVIGAYFVRSMTIYLVQKKTLDSITYLEHGAHWAVFGLACAMLASLLVKVPEIITGGIGLLFVVAAYYSSIVIRRAKET